MKRINQLAMLTLSLTLAGSSLGEIEAQLDDPRSTPTAQMDENADGINDSERLQHRRGGNRQRRNGLLNQLSAEQRAAMKEQIGALRESGASPEEISDVKAAQFTSAGIELPEDFAERTIQRETQRNERIAQREARRALIDGLKAEGATREEIRQAMQEAGYETPRRSHRSGRQRCAKSGTGEATETPAVE